MILGKFKDESPANEIFEFVGLRSKMYSMHLGKGCQDYDNKESFITWWLQRMSYGKYWDVSSRYENTAQKPPVGNIQQYEKITQSLQW